MSIRFLFISCLFISLPGFAQLKSYIIGVHGDTLNRVDMKGQKQGPWVIHVEELRGEPGYDEQGYYQDDKKVDRWVRFSLMGDKIAEENYRWGSLDGKNRYYTRTGGLLREESWRAMEPGKSFDTVDVVDVNDPSKVIDHRIVKVEGSTVRHGTWTYYDPEWGTIQKTENYFMDKLRADDGSIPGEGDSELKPLDMRGTGRAKSDTATQKALAKPQAIVDYEKKNAGKKKVRTRDGNTGY